MAKSVGEIAKTINIEVQNCGIKASESIAKGDIVTWDTSSDCLKATAGTTTISDGFGVALESCTSAVNTSTDSPNYGTAFINVAIGNTYVYCEVGGDVDAGDLLKQEDTQELVLHSAPAVCAGATPTTAEVDAVRAWYGLTVGRYVGAEGDGQDVSNGADGNTRIVRLGL